MLASWDEDVSPDRANSTLKQTGLLVIPPRVWVTGPDVLIVMC